MWEYKIIQTNPNYKADKPFENKLNKLGKEGWELAGVQEKALYFKRPIENVSKMRIKEIEIKEIKFMPVQKPLVSAIGTALREDESP